MRNLTFLLCFSLPLVLSACGSDDAADSGSGMAENETSGDGDGDPSTGDGDPETGDGDPSTGDGDGDPSTGDGDGDPTTGDGDGDGDPGAGYCAQGCVEDADCCPFGSIGCPSDSYPNNWTCNDQGVCEFGGCMVDADCQAGGLQPNMECHSVESQPICFAVCESDNDCVLQPGTTCSGVADDSTMYCAADPAPACENDADCGGYGICNVDTGECGCLEDSNCTASDGNVCVLD